MDIQQFPPLFYATVFAAVMALGRAAALTFSRINPKAFVAAVQRLLADHASERAMKLCRAAGGSVLARLTLKLLESMRDADPGESEWELAEGAKALLQKQLALERGKLIRGLLLPGAATGVAVLCSLALLLEGVPQELHIPTLGAVLLMLYNSFTVFRLLASARDGGDTLIPKMIAETIRRRAEDG